MIIYDLMSLARLLQRLDKAQVHPIVNPQPPKTIVFGSSIQFLVWLLAARQVPNGRTGDNILCAVLALVKVASCGAKIPLCFSKRTPKSEKNTRILHFQDQDVASLFGVKEISQDVWLDSTWVMHWQQQFCTVASRRQERTSFFLRWFSRLSRILNYSSSF